MRQLVIVSAAALVISSFASAPVFAQAAQTAPQAKPAHDLNEVVCEKQEETGSRLASHRICKTRAQWAEERRDNQQDVERIQTQRGCNSNSGC